MICKVALLAVFLAPAFCSGQPVISLSVSDGPPTSSVQVSGRGFAPYAEVDVYFDTQDDALAKADGLGAFAGIAIQAPASALPGTHWVSAVERSRQLGAQAQFQVQTDWTEFHRRNMKRYNPYENVLNVNNVGNLQLKWVYQGADSVFSSLLVAKGMVYGVFETGSVFALSAGTGGLVWSYQADSEVWGTPALLNGVVYVGSLKGTVYAFNASSGAVLWTSNAGASLYDSPAVKDGVVYVGSVYNVWALDASTGAKLWNTPTSNEMISSPAVANGVVYIGSDDHNVYALNASTGAWLWSYATGGQVQSSPAVSNGVVYIGSYDGNVYALNASTGARLWSYATGGKVASSPAVANGLVYVGSGDGNVYALTAKTGTLQWSYATGRDVYLCSPAVANGVVYAGSWGYNLIALNASTGALLWTGPPLESSPTVVNGVVYAGGGGVLAFDVKKDEQEAGVTFQAPDLTMLHPDLNLKVQGTLTGAVSVPDNAPASPQNRPLTGVSLRSAVKFSPPSLTFSDQTVFTTSPTQNVVVTNTGLGILVFNRIQKFGRFPLTPYCGNLKPGASCTISVTFRPTIKGALTGSIYLIDNAPDSPQSVPLAGTGTYMQFSPALLGFGNQPVGSHSLPKEITLTNKGGATVSISKISMSGTNAGDFTLTDTCGQNLAPEASCSITVTFTPAMKGNRTAHVAVSDNGGGSPQKVPLSGTGI